MQFNSQYNISTLSDITAGIVINSVNFAKECISQNCKFNMYKMKL